MKRKTGITMAMLVVIVTVIAILTTVTVTSISNSYNNSKLSVWVTEIGIIQDIMKERKEDVTNVLMDTISFDVSGIDSNIRIEQFAGETIISNKISLREINLAAIGVDNAIYGIHKNNLDIYAYSETTGKVYYLKGLDSRINTFYTLTEDLKNRYGDNLTVTNLSLITFEQSEVSPTENAVKVTVKVPKTYTNISITTSNASIAIGSQVSETTKYKYVVNTNSIKANYKITVTYIENGTEKTATHEVKNVKATLGALITSAEDYGKTVNYVSDNGVTKWRVFYEDTTNGYVYLIATEKLAASKLPSLSNTTVTTSAVTLSDGTSKNVAQLKWSSVPSSATVASDAKIKWKAEWTSYTSANNTKCISYFLDENYWKPLRNTKSSYSSYVLGAIGTPTAELFVLSWNAKKAATGNTTIYNKQITLTPRSTTTGYYVKDASVSTDTYLQALTTLDNLYIWSTSEYSSTWLASPGGVSANHILLAGSSGNLSYDLYSADNRGIRPVVCLNANVPAVQGFTTDFVLVD
ncbi:MAG: hypothetical protein IKL68_02860 [Clostridia bacterium]|nr:hypothetical protein [Clostridia bacterium]